MTEWEMEEEYEKGEKGGREEAFPATI